MIVTDAELDQLAEAVATVVVTAIGDIISPVLDRLRALDQRLNGTSTPSPPALENASDVHALAAQLRQALRERLPR